MGRLSFSRLSIGSTVAGIFKKLQILEVIKAVHFLCWNVPMYLTQVTRTSLEYVTSIFIRQSYQLYKKAHKNLIREITTLCKYSHIGVQLEVSRLVANCKVVLGHLGLGSVEAHLVTGEPSLVADHGSAVDGGAGEVKVDVAAHVNVLALVGRLNFATLLAVEEKQL